MAPPTHDAGEQPPVATHSAQTSKDLAVAGRNAVKLTFSLLATWTVALLITFKLPAYLGPKAYGAFNWAEAFSLMYFSLIELGVDMYITKELAVRPKHASDFFGGLVVVRAAMSATIMAAMATTIFFTHEKLGFKIPLAELQLTVAIFGLTQLVMLMNLSLAAMLQASTHVDKLAVANVTSKLLWGAVLAGAIFAHAPLPILAAPALVSELFKMGVLLPEVRRVLHVEWRIDMRATKAMLIACIPYFLNWAAINVGSRLNVTALGYVASDQENGWYGASQRLAALSLILSPLISWVLMPLLSRAKERSEEEVYQLSRRAMEGLMVVIIPITLIMSLGSDLWVRLAFANKYPESAGSLSVISITFNFVYLGMLMSIWLFMLDRNWSVTIISALSVPIRPVLVVALAGPCARWLGPGGAAIGAAAADMGSNLFVVVAFFWVIGKRAVDTRSVLAIAKSIAVAVAVVFLHRAMVRFGYWRLLVDVIAYTVLALAIGAVRLADILSLVRMIIDRRKAKGAPPPPPPQANEAA